MDELRQAASAYYNNGSPEIQQLAWSFFQSMDTNHDGQVDWHEFSAFLYKSNNQWISASFFNDLDRDGDGALDFMEVLTFYYIIKTRSFWCCVCGICLTGLYFTCVECFDSGNGSSTYDLCVGCYESKPERQRVNQVSDHHHGYFMDNHMLLRSKRGGYGSTNLALNSPGGGPGKARMERTMKALDAAVNVATLCSIM